MGGLAATAVDIKERKSEHPSVVSLCIKGVLLAMPWVGTFWVFHVHLGRRSLCGTTMATASTALWSSFVLMQIFGVCFLMWDLSVLAENEHMLQHAFGTTEGP